MNIPNKYTQTTSIYITYQNATTSIKTDNIMDLSQEKLTKAEWQSIEIPVSSEEQNVLKLIMSGFYDPDVRLSVNQSIATFMKIPMDESMESYIFNQFFQPLLAKTVPPIQLNVSKKIKKADLIRIENMKKNIEENKHLLFEYILIQFTLSTTNSIAQTVYTLIHLLADTTTPGLNRPVMNYLRDWVKEHVSKTSVMEVVIRSPEIIERNHALLAYADLKLFSHQKDLFQLFHTTDPSVREDPRLVLYIAPTGTGKTLSPLGLAQDDYRIIFVCSARHVGLSLAKSAITMEKKVAFAYGCQTAEDIRLHNFSAVDYVKNKRTGGIGKVDNSNGKRVEIMICDVKSYLIAMNYMLEFHPEQDIILYWDEPTITMDYPDHPLHPLIHKNWVENRISKIVLSCATLPKRNEIQRTIDHFLLTFTQGREEKESHFVHSILSYDCRKSISLLDPHNVCVLPHTLFAREPRELAKCVDHCMENKTLLRYLDLGEIVRFLQQVVRPEEIAEYFENQTQKVTMNSIKLYYLKVLAEKMDEEDATWNGTLIYLKESQQSKFSAILGDNSSLKKTESLGAQENRPNNNLYGKGLQRTVSLAEPIPSLSVSRYKGILFTTEDAHTLTDGPTIYLAENVQQIGLFYIQQTQIPTAELNELLRKIHNNNVLQRKMSSIDNEIEDKLGKEVLKEKKMEKEQFSREVKGLKGQLDLLRSQMETMSLRPDYIPNRDVHLNKWAKGLHGRNGKPFTSNLEEADVVRIMELQIPESMKILLLLGVGMFVLDAPSAYLEVIKTLALEQKLYLIIASSDYIYGTNYPFCHGIIGKDLVNMTQQKTIQAMGRIGRNNIQQDYTIRFRNPELLRNLFLPMKENLEAENMSKLFAN